MSSQHPAGRPAQPAPSDGQLEELARRIDAAQRQIDGVLDVLRDLAVSIRDRPARPDGGSRPTPRPDGRRNGTGRGTGAPNGMRGWGH